MNNRVLIQSYIGDLHAEAIAWALQQNGIAVDVWNQAAYPDEQESTVRLSGIPGRDGPVITVDGWDLDNYSVVWSRRRVREFNHSPNLCEADRGFAEAETKKYFDSLRLLSAQRQLWVNAPAAIPRAEAKLVQLDEATRVGLPVPETLATNSAADVTAFSREFGGDIIFKPFQSMPWKNVERDATYIPYTTLVDEAFIEEIDSIRAAPGLYQRRIAKQFEVRALIFGNSYLAAKVDSQAEASARIDWRAGQGNIRFERCRLPDDVFSKSRDLFDRLGIVTGSVDFIVDHTNTYHFLEVNQSGQFLFMEANDPDIPVLDAFSHFLASGDPEFHYDESHEPLTYDGFQKSEAFSAYLENRKSIQFYNQVKLTQFE